MRNSKLFLSFFCTLLIAVIVLGACAPAPTAAPENPTQPAAAEPTKAAEATIAPTVEPTKTAPDKVTMRLSWKWKGEYAAIALADDKGFFSDENIDIEIMEGAGSGEVIPLVAQKQITFSNPSLTTTAVAISQGMEVIAIANLMAKNPIALAHFSTVKLDEPKDLEGKTIALTPGEAFAVIYPAFAEKWGIDTTKVKAVNLDAAVKNQQFLDGGIDVLPTYINNEIPVLRSKTDKQIDAFLPADWGFNTLAGGVITHKDTIQNNPDLVKRFMKALTKAYIYANEHPEEAVQAVKARSQELASQDEEVLLEQVKLTMEMAFGGDQSKPFGWMNAEDWDRTLAPLVDAGTIEKRPDNSALFTNDFLYSEE